MSDDCALPRHRSTPAELRDILTRYRVVAAVGLTTDESRPSYGVAAGSGRG